MWSINEANSCSTAPPMDQNKTKKRLVFLAEHLRSGSFSSWECWLCPGFFRGWHQKPVIPQSATCGLRQEKKTQSSAFKGVSWCWRRQRWGWYGGIKEDVLSSRWPRGLSPPDAACSYSLLTLVSHYNEFSVAYLSTKQWLEMSSVWSRPLMKRTGYLWLWQGCLRPKVLAHMQASFLCLFF